MKFLIKRYRSRDVDGQKFVVRIVSSGPPSELGGPFPAACRSSRSVVVGSPTPRHSSMLAVPSSHASRRSIASSNRQTSLLLPQPPPPARSYCLQEPTNLEDARVCTTLLEAFLSCRTQPPTHSLSHLQNWILHMKMRNIFAISLSLLY
jgi:uncharacterized protein (DUF3084 family)